MIATRKFLPSALLFAALVLGAASAAEPDASDNGAGKPTQQDRVDAVLAQFPPPVPGESRAFFLGFAGFGAERVFAEEIKLAAARVGEKFGSTPRTLLLINDRRDLEAYPLATHAALRYSLRRLGREMDAERDVLFLVLSSHGYENGVIEISNTDMEPVGLSGQTVRAMLDEAGIRWRVIVVSACYSGSFIPPLANDETVLITAARKDRTSFGCSDERHLTYFGEAFFQDALPGAASLRDAFETARTGIARREKRERVKASQPQAHFGPLMEGQLAQ